MTVPHARPAGEHLPELSLLQYHLRCTLTARQDLIPFVLVHDWCVFLSMHGAAHAAHGLVRGHISRSPWVPSPEGGGAPSSEYEHERAVVPGSK